MRRFVLAAFAALAIPMVAQAQEIVLEASPTPLLPGESVFLDFNYVGPTLDIGAASVTLTIDGIPLLQDTPLSVGDPNFTFVETTSELSLLGITSPSAFEPASLGVGFQFIGILAGDDVLTLPFEDGDTIVTVELTAEQPGSFTFGFNTDPTITGLGGGIGVGFFDVDLSSTVQVDVVPEAGSIVMIGLAAAGLGGLVLRRRRTA